MLNNSTQTVRAGGKNMLLNGNTIVDLPYSSGSALGLERDNATRSFPPRAYSNGEADEDGGRSLDFDIPFYPAA